jgi:hypothetical protein
LVPVNFTFSAYLGDTYRLTVNYVAGGSAVNLTGAQAELNVVSGSGQVLLSATTQNGQIAALGASGVIAVTVTDEAVDLWTWREGWGSLKIFGADGSEDTLLAGVFSVYSQNNLYGATALLGQTVTVDISGAVTVQALGTQGPPGPPGPPIGGVPYDVLATQTGAQVITLPSPGTMFMLLINGLRQPQGSASLAGTQLTLTAQLNVVAGDTVTAILTT